MENDVVPNNPSQVDYEKVDQSIHLDYPQLRRAMAYVNEIIEREIASGIPPEKIFLSGYSQGGLLTLATALTSQYKLGAVKEALSYGSNAVMIYLGAPQNTRRRPLTELKIPEFRQILAENNIDIDNVIVHGPYVVNLANPAQVARMEAIGLKTLILHPGSAVDAPINEALSQVAKGINLVLQSSSQVRIVLETMCGRGSEVGVNFEQLKCIIDRVEQKERELGAKVDRHENIGYGNIGLKALKKIV
ncbi:15937_t:CDS:2 [Cetraspora pellucida]|uniref:15937_t:CDS:1 n=1 Tax=Cetraspora pellucida TaxID=1433469 RepID=A0ACA9K6Q1_9GLOM|nr:15937_t:CDS:2 [Cetraspora pellucida]